MSFANAIQYINPKGFQRLHHWSESYLPYNHRAFVCKEDGRVRKVVVAEHLKKESIWWMLLKTISYATIIFPLIACAVKLVFRSMYTFSKIDLDQEISQGWVLPDPVINLLGKDLYEGRSYFSPGDPRTSFGEFFLKRFPGYILRENTYPRQEMAAIRKAKEVCLIYDLNLLEVTKIAILPGRIEGDLLGRPSHLLYESICSRDIYCNRANELDAVIDHLMRFVFETEIYPMNWAANPLFQTKEGKYKVMISHPYKQGDIKKALFGEVEGDGLIHMLYEKRHIEKVLQEAVNRKILSFEEAKKMGNQRLIDIEREKAVYQFYEMKQMGAKDPLNVRWKELGLDLDRKDRASILDLDCKDAIQYKEKEISFLNFAESVVGAINQQIQETPDYLAQDYKRRAFLDISGPFFGFQDLGRGGSSPSKNWFRELFDALSEKGYIFGVLKEDVNGYIIQA